MPGTRARTSRSGPAIVEIGSRWLSSLRHQIREEIAFLLGRAFALEHVLAITFEPLLHLGGVTEARRVCERRQRLDRFAGDRVAAATPRIIRMTRAAAPIGGLLEVQR